MGYKWRKFATQAEFLPGYNNLFAIWMECMRLIGTLDDGKNAERLADYLIAQGIDAQIDSTGEAWAVWVRDEDLIEQAVEEFDRFRLDPTDSRYRESRRAAEDVRRQAQQRQQQVAKNTVDVRRGWRRPGGARRAPLTMTLIVLSVVVAFASNFGNTRGRGSVVSQLTFQRVPIEDENAREDPLAQIKQGQVWRLATPMFIHFGPLHLVFNMLWLHWLGGMIETRKGTVAFGGLVLLTCLIANVAQALFPENATPMFGGMSGVVYGLFGYIWISMTVDPGIGLFLRKETVVFLFGWLFLGMAGVFEQMDIYIANWAHGGGLIAGVALALVAVAWRRGKTGS